MDTRTAIEARRSTALATSREEREVQRLEAVLEPCQVDEAMRALAPMFTALPLADRGDVPGFVNGFRYVVKSHPLWAVKEAVGAFIRGRVEDHKSAFCPNTAEFGRELDRRVDRDRTSLHRARTAAREATALAIEEGRAPRSPEAKAFGDAALARLRAVADADREARRKPVGPDLSQWQVKRDEEPSKLGYRGPLTPEDVKDVPDAPPRATGTMQHAGNYAPLRNGALSPDHLPEQTR